MSATSTVQAVAQRPAGYRRLVPASLPRLVEWEPLLRIARDALQLSPPRYVSSIFGKPLTWIPPFHRYSEFRIIDVWRLRRTLKFLYNTWMPSIPRTPPTFGPPFLNNLFWQPSVILQRPDHEGSYTSFPEEAWFFINGVMTNDAVAQVNSAYIAYLFHRPVTMIWNSTDSLFVDLFECAIGKEWYGVVEPAIKALPPIYEALKSRHKSRVVVICHSQGTIIMSVVLRLLRELASAEVRGAEPRAERAVMAAEAAPYAPPEFVYPDEEKINLDDFEALTGEELAKLEVYCFANCANQMEAVVTWKGRIVPWIESYGNEKDIVARLGMLAPHARARGIRVDGLCYMHRGAWGHLLNEHYLLPIERSQKTGRKPGGNGTGAPYEPLTAGAPLPRLFSYINGGTPAL